MKFIVATYGAEGGARPFAALCRGLMEAGHVARLLADAATLGSAQALGVATTALAGDIRGTLSPDQAMAALVAKGGGFNDTARAGDNRQRERRILDARDHRRPGKAAMRLWQRGSPRLPGCPRPNTWAPRASAPA